MGNKPTAAFVLSLIGGIFILLGGLFIVAVGAIVSSVGFGGVGGAVSLYGGVGALLGILVVVGAVMLWIRPQQHIIWGILIIVFAVISLYFAFFGGFGIGFLLSLIGGILALVYKPMPMMIGGGMMPGAMPGPGAPGVMTCPACGGAVNMQTRTCTMCGRAV
ncbi:MAG: DUF6114 domain-containing protein [Thermoplasmata archaeon]|nr:DUF6114 domain-containing protein [Thermoplasmata archaeon]